MPDGRRDKCFVVMPFGIKPVPGEPGRDYDFDKVYRVLIRRAVQESGLQPVRADEESGSHIIHTGMFRELRDRPVVLADLSLENPNVFYELGVRHVMAATGTVLICRRGQKLPFDVRMSRVIPYEYDGRHLDWEEVERVIPQIRAALLAAQGAEPDSPVHSLLDTVLRPAHAGPEEGQASNDAPGAAADPNARYQRMVAAQWKADGGKTTVEDRLAAESESVFGTRAIGYLCLDGRPAPETSVAVATRLYHMEQYDLALELFRTLEAEGSLPWRARLRYASTVSEATRTARGTDQALEIARSALASAEAEAEEKPDDARALALLARCRHSYAGLLIRKWRITRSDLDLTAAIDALREQEASIAEAVAANHDFELGLVALLHLRLLLLLRKQGEEDESAEIQRHRDAVLKLRPTDRTDARSRSYLRWYQAIAMADAGNEQAVDEALTVASTQDARAAQQGRHHEDLGRRQYTHLRRLIQDNAHRWRNRTLVDRISRTLRVLQTSEGP